MLFLYPAVIWIYFVVPSGNINLYVYLLFDSPLSESVRGAKFQIVNGKEEKQRGYHHWIGMPDFLCYYQNDSKSLIFWLHGYDFNWKL